jgi:hypothetical protein
VVAEKVKNSEILANFRNAHLAPGHVVLMKAVQQSVDSDSYHA